MSAAVPAPGSANIWDTDLFQDSNVANAGIPTGHSPVVTALHGAGKYSICYVEAGAYQAGFPDDSDFAAGDYTNGSNSNTTAMRGWSGEWWFDLRGFAGWSTSNPTVFPGGSAADQAAAVNIAAGLAKRFSWCALEGQDGVEADDLDGYTNPSNTGAAGGGWGLTKQDSVGFEAWIAYTVHADGLAWFDKNDAANGAAAVADGYIIEECNYYDDPCGTKTQQGDATPFLQARVPVLNAEYMQGRRDDLEILLRRQRRRHLRCPVRRQPRRRHLPALLDHHRSVTTQNERL